MSRYPGILTVFTQKGTQKQERPIDDFHLLDTLGVSHLQYSSLTMRLLLHFTQLKRTWCFYPWGRDIWFFLTLRVAERLVTSGCGNVFLMYVSTGAGANIKKIRTKFAEAFLIFSPRNITADENGGAGTTRRFRSWFSKKSIIGLWI